MRNQGLERVKSTPSVPLLVGGVKVLSVEILNRVLYVLCVGTFYIRFVQGVGREEAGREAF